MTEPDFLDDEHPRDGSRSVTSLGGQAGPLHGEPTVPSHGTPLATPGLGVHVMDSRPEDAEPASTEPGDTPTDDTAPDDTERPTP